MVATKENMIKFGILTVSDRCFHKQAVDESGPSLEKILESNANQKYKIEVKSCVPDDIDTIQKVLRSWSDEKDIHVILTTGGTGFAPRDVTPEATRGVIDREAPGVAFAMAKGSLDKTPMAMLSRAVCGIRKQTLIVNLPGSKKAATECLLFIVSCIPHAVAVMRNWLPEVNYVHTSMQASADQCVPAQSAQNQGHTCGHHTQSSKVDVSYVARRPRNSPFPMISYKDSTEILDTVLSTVDRFVEQISARNSLGYVLESNVLAQNNLPPFPASVKDGYAVKVSDGAGIRKVVADSTAGSQPGQWSLSSGECVRINTGAPVPEGADAVVQVEDTRLISEDDDGRKELEIEILVAPKVGQDIRAVGSDICQGQVIAQPTGNPLTSQDLGLFAAAGVDTILIFRRPVISVFSTGNELQEPGVQLQPGQIWDSNRLMLNSLFKESGFEVLDLGIVRDDSNQMLEKMKYALECSDIVVTTGSVSMGDKDMLKAILSIDLGAEIHFGRVNLKPGKPTTFASWSDKNNPKKKKLIFCLPGNPVSAYVTSHLYVLRAVRHICGVQEQSPVSVYAKIQTGQRVDEREEFKRGRITCKGNEDAFVQVIGGCMLSSNILSCQSSNCLVRIPPKSVLGKDYLEENSFVECLLTGKL